MFDSLALEDPRSTRRRWATFMSFTLETMLLGMLIAAPLAFTEKLQLVKLGEVLIAPTGMPTQPTPQPPTTPIMQRSVLTEFSEGHLIYTGNVPNKAKILVDPTDVSIGDNTGVYVPGAIPGPGKPNPLLQNLIKPGPSSVGGPPVTATPRVAISHLDPGFLINRVQPTYSRLAISARIEGTVSLAAVIDTSGRITQLRAISGHPLLIPAAIDAVRQWRYKPYILNGSPVEVETQVSVVFSLNH